MRAFTRCCSSTSTDYCASNTKLSNGIYNTCNSNLTEGIKRFAIHFPLELLLIINSTIFYVSSVILFLPAGIRSLVARYLGDITLFIYLFIYLIACCLYGASHDVVCSCIIEWKCLTLP